MNYSHVGASQGILLPWLSARMKQLCDLAGVLFALAF